MRHIFSPPSDSSMVYVHAYTHTAQEVQQSTQSSPCPHGAHVTDLVAAHPCQGCGSSDPTPTSIRSVLSVHWLSFWCCRVALCCPLLANRSHYSVDLFWCLFWQPGRADMEDLRQEKLFNRYSIHALALPPLPASTWMLL